MLFEAMSVTNESVENYLGFRSEKILPTTSHRSQVSIELDEFEPVSIDSMR